MAKKKVLKMQIGEAYDKDARKSYPVYVSYWQNDDGSYSRSERVFVNEVEVPDKKPSSEQVEA